VPTRDPSRHVPRLPVPARAYPHLPGPVPTRMHPATPSLLVHGGAAALLAVLHGSDRPTGWKQRCMAVPLGEGDATLLVALHGSGAAAELGPTWVVKL
jgi:hypothetical protein